MKHTAGYKDMDFGIRTFPTGGTERFRTVDEFVDAMRIAASKCGDSQYREGTLLRIREYDEQKVMK